MTHARAGPAAGFKFCCMLTGEYDGSDRDHFFQGVNTSHNRTVVRAARARSARPSP